MKTTTFAICLMATLMAVKPAMAKSGNGESYSGPTLAPQAVAISVDKPILGTKFRDYLHACITEGGENSFAMKLIKPLYPNFKFVNDPVNVSIDTPETTLNDEIRVKTGYFYLKSPSVGTLSDRNLEFNLKSTGSLIVTDFQLTGNGAYATRVLEIKSFPIFKAQEKRLDIFDPISGDFKGTDIILQNLQVIYDFRNSSPYVKATNITISGKPGKTELVAPVGDLVNCLVEKLGKI